MKVTGLFLLVFFISGTMGEGESELFPTFLSSCGYTQYDYFYIATTLTKVLNFFIDNLENLVLDAAVGTRILEGQVQLILEANPKLSHRVLNSLRQLFNKANRISTKIAKAYSRAEKVRREERNNTLPWITKEELWKTPRIGNWILLYPGRHRDGDLSWNSFLNKTEAMDEDISDSCIGELFRGCEISPVCRKLFLETSHSKYSLTHQVIYIHVAEQLACNGSLDYTMMKAGWCARVEKELEAIEVAGFPNEYQDLFAEQITVCAIAGFSDFLRSERSDHILSWQIPISQRNSCFGVHPYGNKRSERQKRSETSIYVEEVECSVHFSAVAVGALSMHLRHLLETCVLQD